MKQFKKLTAVFLALTMVVSTVFVNGIGTASYAAEADDSTITLPLTIRDAHMDGFIFENANLSYNGAQRGSFDEVKGGLCQGLINNTLDDKNKIVYTDESILGLANNIKRILDKNDVGSRAAYETLLKALRNKVGYTGEDNYNLGSKEDSKTKDLTDFNNINTCYDVAVWMTYYLYRDGQFTYNGKTYDYTQSRPEYSSLVLQKQTDGSYSFSATTANEKVLYDTTNHLIKNDTSSNPRGGFFPLDNIGFGNEYDDPKGQAKYDHNFAYTLESSGKFVYYKDANLYFDFNGDDDVYLFINKKLALDIGGQHGQINDVVRLEDNCTVSGHGTQTWAEYLELEEGKIYDFNFFYMERHTSAANMSIKTNIRVYNANAVPQKNAYADGKQIPYGGLVAENTDITYEFVLTNTGDTPITNLTFTDSDIGVTLNEDQIQLNNLTTEADITVEKIDKNGTTNYTCADLIGSTGLLANGLAPGETIKIKGFKYRLGSEEFKNTMSYTAKFGDKTLTDIAEALVVPVTSSDKAFVVDYGKSVTYGYDKVFNQEPYGDVSIGGRELFKGIYGTMTNNLTSQSITYTLNKFMQGIDEFIFKQIITSTDDDGNKLDTTLYTTVKMIPATTIYYEDNFGSSGTNNTDADAGIVYSGEWNVVENNGESQTGDNPYGYDNSYSDDSKDSNGSVAIVNGNGTTTKATFNFTGTGFDIVGRTSYDSGTIRVDVFKVDENGNVSTTATRSKLVATEYKDNGNQSILYQIPVLKIRDLDYGKYKVVITVCKENIFSNNTTFYLDGIRIYNPMGSDQTANDKYVSDKEGYPQYIELRDKLIGEGNLDSNGNSVEDAVLFIDSKGKANLDEFEAAGPNNEIYLSTDQSVGFRIDNLSNVASIQIGAKSINGSAAIEINNDKNSPITLDSATDMYYDITKYIKDDGILFIKSTGINPASLTHLKITYKQDPKASSVSNFALARLLVDNDVVEAISKNYVDLSINSVKFSSQKVKVNSNINMTIKTSKDVKQLSIIDKSGNVVKPKKVRLKEGTDENTFKVTLKAPSKADSEYYYKIVGLDKDGNAKSEVFTTKTIVIKKR